VCKLSQAIIELEAMRVNHFTVAWAPKEAYKTAPSLPLFDALHEMRKRAPKCGPSCEVDFEGSTMTVPRTDEGETVIVAQSRGP
jgi:hypothetical protein